MTNRIIKFRAWDKPHGHMTEVDVMRFNLNGEFRGIETHTSEISETPYGAHDIVLMQFTGLHDKNGKEIYEGDVVRYRTELGKVMEVKYPDCFDGESDWSIYLPANWEVIGNIYENSDLLEK